MNWGIILLILLGLCLLLGILNIILTKHKKKKAKQMASQNTKKGEE